MTTGEPKANAVPDIRNKSMRKTFFLVALMFAVATSAVGQEPAAPANGSAQEPTSSANKQTAEEKADDANVQLMRKNIRAERKKIVAANMPLTEAEATKFWPLYERYVGETIKVNDARYALIKEYAQNYTNITDAQADSYIKRWVALDGDNTQLRIKYIPEFEKVISHKKTALFFQIDRRLSMMVELQLASQIPLIEP
ncbi:MAG TPA: hypothetical protein VKH81_24565 [Candidatus Angelobacter sp.]|nr:hypothetical protein [Candidatus Angelobacter sp.]